MLYKNFFHSISFHPKFAAGLDVVLSIIMVWWLTQVSAWWMLAVWLGFRSALWVALVRLVYYPAEVSRWRHFLSLFLFAIGSTAFLLFIEWSVAWYLIAILTVILPAVSFWLLPPVSGALSFLPKPHRRWRLFISLFGLAGIWSGIYAFADFQIFVNSGSWLWLLVGTFMATLVAAWWWNEYGIKPGKRFWIWFCILFLLMLEFTWVIMTLPLGFMTGGLVLVWLWYFLWLLARFELSDKGINWQKHKWSVIINILLMVFYLLLVVRWQ